MRGKSLVSLLGFVFCFCSLSTLAQAEEQKAQFFLVVEEVVKPPLVSEFEEASKEEFVFLAEHTFPYTCHMYATDNYTYYYVWPVKDYADIGILMSTWMALQGRGSWCNSAWGSFISQSPNHFYRVPIVWV